MAWEKDPSDEHECQGKEHDHPIVGLAPQQHAADREPHTGRGNEKQAAHQVEPADQEVCDEDCERKDKYGDPAGPSEEEPASILMEISHVVLALWVWKGSRGRCVLDIHGKLLVLPKNSLLKIIIYTSKKHYEKRYGRNAFRAGVRNTHGFFEKKRVAVRKKRRESPIVHTHHQKLQIIA